MAILTSAVSIFVILISICSTGLALELTPIRPAQASKHGSLGKRDTSGLNLLNYEHFLWGYDDNIDKSLANFTIYTPHEDDHILSMEKFDGMLKSVQCSPDRLVLQFIDDETFAYAQREWDWVNGADNHTFLMVTGSGQCGGNRTDRIPYMVQSLEYDEEKNVATLTATEGDFKSFAKSYSLNFGDIGHVGASSSDGALDSRDLSKDASFSIASKFPFSFKVSQGPFSGKLECDGCQTTGKMVFQITISQNVIGIPDGVSFSMRPSGVSATVGLKLTIAAKTTTKLEKKLDWRETVLTIPLSGFSIPGGVLNLGPVLDIDVGGGFTALEGSLSVGAKGTSKLSDSAVLKADFLNPSKNEFSGWLPTLDFEPPTIQAKVATTAQVFLMPAVRLKASVLEKGVETGLDLQLPSIDLKLENVLKPAGGVCNQKDKTVGIQIQPYIGASLKFSAGSTDGKFKPVDITIATKAFEIGNPICIASTGPDPKDPTPSPKSTPTSSAKSSKSSTPAGKAS